MKKHLLFGFVLFIGLMRSAWAQPVLDACHNLPEPGDRFKVEHIVCDSNNVSAGPAGPNRYWDFAHWVTENSGISYDTIDDPQQTPYFNVFPDANIGMHSYSEYHYSAVSDSQINYLGYASPLFSVPVIYSDPELNWVCPFEYGEHFYDEIKFDLGAMVHFKGNKTVTYDAYGLLKLPNLQYYNVVRMHVRSIMVRDQYGRIYDNYIWYETTNLRQICSLVRYTNLDRAVWFTLPTITIHTPVSPVGTVETAEQQVEVSPNPAHDRVHIRTAASQTSGEWLLSDIYGREVLRQRISATETDVDISGLATGIYIGRLITPRGVVIETGKIVKE